MDIDNHQEDKDCDTTSKKLQNIYGRSAPTNNHDIRDTFIALCADDILSFSCPKIKITSQEKKIILIHALQQITQNCKIQPTERTRINMYQHQHAHIQCFFQQCEQNVHQQEKISKCVEQLKHLIHKYDQQCQTKNYQKETLFINFLPSTLCNAIISLKNTIHPCADVLEKVCQYAPQQQQQISIHNCIAHLHHEITVLHNYDVLFYLHSLNKNSSPAYQLPENRKKIQNMITFLQNNGENLKQLEILLWRAHQKFVPLRCQSFIQSFPKKHEQLSDSTYMQQKNSSQQKTNITQQQTILLQHATKTLLYIQEMLRLLRPNADETFLRHFFSSSCDSFTYIANVFSLNETLPRYVQQTNEACMRRIARNYTQLKENATSDDKQDEKEIPSLEEFFIQQEISQQDIPSPSDFPPPYLQILISKKRRSSITTKLVDNCCFYRAKNTK